MTHVVDTSIAAVKISGGSFAVPDFSSSEEEGEDATIAIPPAQGRRRSNAFLSAQPANNDTKPTASQRRSGKFASNSGLGDAVGSFSDTSCKSESQSSPTSYTTALSSSLRTSSVSDVISNNNCGGSPEQRGCKDDGPIVVGDHASSHDDHDGVKHTTRKAESNSRHEHDISDTASESIAEEKQSSRSSHEKKHVLSSSPLAMMKARHGAHDSISTTSTQSTNSGGENTAHSTKEAFFQSRFNPFDRDIHMEEDHFSDNPDGQFFCRDSSSPSALSSHSSGLDGGSLAGDSDKVTFAELGLTEDHFSHPEVGGHFGFTKTEELQAAIDQCKSLISKAQPHSDRQKNLVEKLVELRLRLQELKEPEEREENVVQALGHRLLRKDGRSTKYYCEKCNNIIWGVVQEWRKCLDCGYRCHDKCVPLITRNCAMVKVKENPVLIMEICPRLPKGLMAQDYRCAECKAQIPVGDGVEPRLCEYNGRYYCDMCHWNDLMYIPAQILLNWDFEKYKVCRASKQFLKLMMNKAVIKVQAINPSLFNYVEQLNDIKNLREELLLMKKYILACPTAMQSKLLLQLSSRPHFVECSDRYSLQDLLDSDDKLVPDLVQVHSQWAQHIKTDCELCQGRGYFCELCTSKEVLFPFDNIAVVCPSCSSVMHRICFAQQVKCPKCERRRQRQAEGGPSKR